MMLYHYSKQSEALLAMVSNIYMIFHLTSPAAMCVWALNMGVSGGVEYQEDKFCQKILFLWQEERLGIIRVLTLTLHPAPCWDH